MNSRWPNIWSKLILTRHCLSLFVELLTNGHKFYVVAEHRARLILKIFLIFFVSSITASLLIPVAVVIYYYLNGSYSMDKWKLPTVMEYDILPINFLFHYLIEFRFNFRLYFDVNESPTYEIAYCICLLAGYSIAYIIPTFTAFFVCVTVYIIACFKDVRQMISLLDEDRFGSTQCQWYISHFSICEAHSWK